jgi:hypothetical protein
MLGLYEGHITWRSLPAESDIKPPSLSRERMTSSLGEEMGMADVIEPPGQGQWPKVTSTEDPPPPATSVAVEDGTVLKQPPRVVAHGRVAGIPWKIQAWATAPVPGAKWWDVMEPVGPEMEFELGASGFLGGGGVHLRVPERHAFTASGHFFGRAPFVIAWAGSVSEIVERLEVSLADGRTREIALHEGPEGFPRLFWFFPPRGVGAELVAYGPGGRALERQALPEPEVEPDANTGTSVNPSGWRADQPPPGWPQEDRHFAPGEGPRREEDFLLHIAPFPVFVVPPKAWKGIAMLGGHGGRGNAASYVPTRVEFEYLDRAGEPTRGMRIVNVDPDEEARLEELYAPYREPGVWWFDTVGDAAHLPQLPGRFLPETQATGGRSHSATARRYVGQGGLTAVGSETDFERWEYRDYPQLVEIRFSLPGVAIRIEGWDLDADEVLGFAARLQPLELGSELLKSMTDAAASATSAWQSWFQERNPD